MSELQVSLLSIGAVVIAGVYLFNLWQERLFRQRAERAFALEHDDALLKNTASLEKDRVEPQLPRMGALSKAHVPQQDYIIDTAIDYVVEVSLTTPGNGADLQGELRTLAANWRKPVLVAGRNVEGNWVEAGVGSGIQFSCLRFALQMSNRAGCIDENGLTAFRDAVIKWSAQVGGEAIYPNTAEAYEAAASLDLFCTEVDIAIGVNVVGRDGKSFYGAQIRELAEAAGLKLEADGVFYYRGNHSLPLFTVDNHEPMPFVPEQVNTLQTGGITLLLDVPRVSDGERIFDLMLETARDFASKLDGILVDDKRVPLSISATEKIRLELRAILEKMDAARVAAGSTRALRLFS